MGTGTMNTIAHTVDAEADLEAKIADIVAPTTALAKTNQKGRLRQAFTELSVLKSQRTAVEVYRLECERGLGDFV